MSENQRLNVGAVASVADKKEVTQKRAPTLYAIIIFKLAKGTLFLAAAIAVYCLSNDDLPAEFHSLLHFMRIQPDTEFYTNLAVKIGNLTEGTMLKVAGGTLLYSLFSLVEGIGLAFRISWAGWLAIGESAFFIPLEVGKLMQKSSYLVFGVLVINILIVWYLIQNRHRLFHHHQTRPN
jgi:uncharacterized membrane protein (DUF2068 family)